MGRTELKSPCQHRQWSDGLGINQTSIMIPKYPRACYAAAAYFLGRMATPIRYSSASEECDRADRRRACDVMRGTSP